MVFVGQAYGKRPAMVAELRKRGVSVQTFGRGWPGSRRISQAELIKVYNQSKIILNSYVSSSNIIALNARDFEAAACGSMVVTQDIPEVRKYFEPGKEIITYRDMDEAAEKIRYYLEYDEEREKIAAAGYERTLREHTYEKRFRDIFAFANRIS